MRRRILVLTLSTTFLVVLAFVLPLVILVDHETSQRAGLDLQSQAQTTAFDVRSTYTAAQITTLIDERDEANGTSTQVIRNGVTIGSLPPGVGDIGDGRGLPSIAPSPGCL